jgi:hypothetical protein
MPFLGSNLHQAAAFLAVGKNFTNCGQAVTSAAIKP